MLPGLMNDEVKPYNSLDLGVTFLASKKVIIHASTSNILCRKNEFGKVDNKGCPGFQRPFFYVGVYCDFRQEGHLRMYPIFRQ